MKVVPTVLCGGSGSRLWPLSRTGFPKQFLVFSGNSSLFQQAVERLNSLTSSDIELGETLVVTNEDHRFLVLDQLRELSGIKASLILEPEGRNTAPALTLASLQALACEEDPVLVVTPADQTIEDLDSFVSAVQNGIRIAEAQKIVILGITPTSPETGYGYIEQSEDVGKFGEYDVRSFKEKPDQATAIRYLESGGFLWNSGMFILRASVWLDALKAYKPDIFDAISLAHEKRLADSQFIRPDKLEFLSCANESIDYAVIEKCASSEFQLKVIPLDAGWSDLGAWNAVWETSKQDELGNVIKGDVFVENTKNSLVYASHRMVAAVGIKDLIVVETADSVLVVDRSLSQDVKKIVKQLELRSREERILHRKVFRPWGWYDTLDFGDQFKVKRIQVNPGSKLSLQKHLKRAEHWVVVKGVAEITSGDRTFTLTENQSTYISLGEKHRLSNPSSSPLEIIEVQSGVYLGEDDIVRLDDNYGRKE